MDLLDVQQVHGDRGRRRVLQPDAVLVRVLDHDRRIHSTRSRRGRRVRDHVLHAVLRRDLLRLTPAQCACFDVQLQLLPVLTTLPALAP